MNTNSDNLTIACVGDTMPGGILHYEKDNDFCSEDVLAVLKKADIRVATLETAIGDAPNFDNEKMKRDKDVIYCHTADLWRLTAMNINVVSLANNHAWDLGYEGIVHAKSELDKLGIKYCGAGANINEASDPAVIDANGKSVAFIAYCDYKPGTCGYIPIASDDNPGINAMIPDNIRENISRLKGRYDYLFVMMHWGKEYYTYPTPEVNRLAKKIIDWGADGVIGSHSHQIQPTVFHKGKPIIFSLGNFFFPDRFITSPRSTYYPDESPDLRVMPQTLGYPFVKEPTFKIWKPAARIGQIVTLDITSKSISFETKLTKMDKNSHLDIAEIHPSALFSITKKLVKFSGYDTLFFIMRGCRYAKKKINKQL